jgi:hypothetical protein
MDLRSRLLKALPNDAFKLWFAPLAAFDWAGLALHVATDPEHADAAKADQIIEALPDTFAGFDIYRVEWPRQPTIGD